MKRLNFRRAIASATCISAHAAIIALSAAIALPPTGAAAQAPGQDPGVTVPEKPADQSAESDELPGQGQQPERAPNQTPPPAQNQNAQPAPDQNQRPAQDQPRRRQADEQQQNGQTNQQQRRQADQQQDRQPQEQQSQRDQAAGRGELGVMLSTQNGRPQITQVLRGSAAADAGLQAGDLIVAVNGEDVSSDRQLSQMIGQRGAGEQVELTILRGQQQQTLTATLNERRTVGFRGEVGGQQQQMTGAWLGVLLDAGRDRDAQGQQGDEAPVEQGRQRGAVVQQVYPGGPAARAGLRPGDVIISAGESQIASPQELQQTIDDRSPGDEVAFTVLRGEQEQQLTAQLGDRSEFAFEMNAPSIPNGQQAGFEDDPYGGIDEHAMMLEQHRRFAEQHQRIESLVVEALNEIAELRKEVQELRGQRQ